MGEQIYSEGEMDTGYIMHKKKRYKLQLDKKTGKVKEIYDPINPRVIDRMKLFLSDDEVKMLINVASNQSNTKLSTTYLAMIQLMLYSGLRRENVANLKWNQVDLENKLIELEGIDVKTKMPIKVPIWDETLIHLKILKNNSQVYVFMHDTKGTKGSKKRYSLTQINNIVGKLGREANIQPKNNFKNVNPHLLRHTWVRLCKKKGVRKDILKIWGGWKTEKMIEQIYGMPDIDDVKNEYKKLKGDNQ